MSPHSRLIITTVIVLGSGVFGASAAVFFQSYHLAADCVVAKAFQTEAELVLDLHSKMVGDEFFREVMEEKFFLASYPKHRKMAKAIGHRLEEAPRAALEIFARAKPVGFSEYGKLLSQARNGTFIFTCAPTIFSGPLFSRWFAANASSVELAAQLEALWLKATQQHEPLIAAIREDYTHDRQALCFSKKNLGKVSALQQYLEGRCREKPAGAGRSLASDMDPAHEPRLKAECLEPVSRVQKQLIELQSVAAVTKSKFIDKWGEARHEASVCE